MSDAKEVVTFRAEPRLVAMMRDIAASDDRTLSAYIERVLKDAHGMKKDAAKAKRAR